MDAPRLYAKVCEQCGVAITTAQKNLRFCKSCARARVKAARACAAKRDRAATKVPCVCGRRLIPIHNDYDRCSECRKELAAKRRQVFAIPRAIGERMRLPEPPKR
jgi:hypothetical protein